MLEVGPIDLDSLPFVCPSAVRSSARPSVISFSTKLIIGWIPLIFCIKLSFSKSKKVTKPDFGKEKFGPNWGKLSPNLPKFEVFGHFLEFESLDGGLQ